MEYKTIYMKNILACAWLLLPAGSYAAAAQDALPTSDAYAVLEAYIEAIGGREAIERIENRVTRGTLKLGEFTASITLYQRLPDHYRMVQVFDFGEVDQGYDGEQGWRTIPGEGRAPVTGEELEDQRFQFSIRQPLVLDEVYSVSAQSEVRMEEGRPLNVLEFTAHSGPQEWFFDAETHLLERIEADVQMGSGETVKVETALGDWRDVDGVLIPHRMHSRVGDTEVQLEYASVVHNQTLIDDDFAPGGRP